MAQVKLLKINSDGLPQEFDQAADEITLLSFSVDGGGPVLSSTGLELNNTNISEIDDLSFNDATSTITSNAGTFDAEDLMFDSKENSMELGASILFPTVSNTGDEVDAFRLPTISGTPTAAPTDGGSGYLVYDSTNFKLYAYDGSQWDDLSTVQAAQKVCNVYTAGENIAQADIVYISAANTVMKAIANSDTSARAIGAAGAAISNAAQGDICSEGVVSGFSGLTAGSRYYLSAATAGAVTTTAPIGGGNNIVNIGFAKSATEMQLQIHFLGKRA